MAPLPLKANGTVLHRQLFTALRSQIMAGQYREGERLPTQEQLAEQFSVSRITVRRAMADLQAAGLIRNEQGVGAFVQPREYGGPPEATLNFLQGLQRVVQQTAVRVLALETRVPPESVRTALQLGAGAHALHVVRMRYRGKEPLLFLDAWLPERFVDRVSVKALKHTPLYDLITAEDHSHGTVVQEITAELADPSVAAALDIEVNSAILRLTRLVYDSQKYPVQHLVIRATPQRSRMLMRVSGELLNTINAGHLLHDVKGAAA